MRYDVVVVGARCAGSPLAMLLARAGLDVLLVDRARFPSDTPNGHMIKPSGVARLASWGVLEDVLATGVPRIAKRHLVIGSSMTERLAPEHGHRPIAPRRYALDQVLLEAAERAGADVRTRTTVVGLPVDGERVVGVRLVEGSGREVEARARVVVGADGRNSRVARRIGAGMVRDDGTTSVAYWRYWSGVPVRDATLVLDQGLAAGVIPTNDDLTLAWVQAPVAAARRFRADPEGRYLEALRRANVLDDLLAGARPEGRMLGMISLPNFVRRAHGPGWALVGDAGHHKDPLAARGITDSFRDAELLAQALARGLDGTEAELTAELARYERVRDEANAEVYAANLELSRLDHPVAELPALFGALEAAERDADASHPPLGRFASRPRPLGSLLLLAR